MNDSGENMSWREKLHAWGSSDLVRFCVLIMIPAATLAVVKPTSGEFDVFALCAGVYLLGFVCVYFTIATPPASWKVVWWIVLPIALLTEGAFGFEWIEYEPQPPTWLIILSFCMIAGIVMQIRCRYRMGNDADEKKFSKVWWFCAPAFIAGGIGFLANDISPVRAWIHITIGAAVLFGMLHSVLSNRKTDNATGSSTPAQLIT